MGLETPKPFPQGLVSVIFYLWDDVEAQELLDPCLCCEEPRTEGTPSAQDSAPH